MIPVKYKSAHYLVNRFKPLAEVIKWFEREDAIYSDEEIFDLLHYFKRKAGKDMILLSECGSNVEDWEKKLVATGNIFNYCHNNIQQVHRERIDKLLKEPA
jgi:hypothetical protein